ncbi:phage antirepressor KilAC domain-containing protein [Cupriavidus pauculus]|uniref:phage antirepressor KilAC domain-containing protein n=1 Tax=Cupriavidus pauculus TaxID=82633 RepID=UPI001C934106|nr:phage antirepressor KilAC domain-containing protein [Cupriavidus pauculus]MBY4733804.1 phage antirepressor KilAC domain-containing protein [Cupriavidus pauculus]
MIPNITFDARKWRQRRRAQAKHRNRVTSGFDITIPSASMSVTSASKALSIARRELFAYLDSACWLSRGPEGWFGCPEAIDRGWVIMRRKTIGYRRYAFQAIITPLGLEELAKRLMLL